jgi:dGTPase
LKDLPVAIIEYQRRQDLELATWPGAEAQVAALSDDIAYNNHDIDDGLRAGLFTLADICSVPLVGDAVAQVRAKYPALDEHRLVGETTRRLIDLMIRDVLGESRRRLAALQPANVEAIRGHDTAVIAFSPEMAAADKRLKEFLFERMYRHYRVNRMTSKARRVVRELFELLFREPDCLPEDWRDRALNADERRRARLVADYIAGMTDRFALLEHRRLLDVYE